MLTEREVISTIDMLRSEHLDVRTVTLGLNLFDCISDDFGTFSFKVRTKIHKFAKNLVSTCNEVGDRYGIPVVNKENYDFSDQVQSVQASVATRWLKHASFSMIVPKRLVLTS